MKRVFLAVFFVFVALNIFPAPLAANVIREYQEPFLSQAQISGEKDRVCDINMSEEENSLTLNLKSDTKICLKDTVIIVDREYGVITPKEQGAHFILQPGKYVIFNDPQR